MLETWFQSLSWEDPLEEGLETHSSILAWKIPMDKGAWWATVHQVTESDTFLVDNGATFDSSQFSTILPQSTQSLWCT